MSEIDLMLWLDLETDGGHITETEVFEIGAFFTTPDLEKIDAPEFHAVIRPTPQGLTRLFENPVVVDMHSKSGLLRDMSDVDISLPVGVARNNLNAWYHEHAAGKDVQLAGSGVASFDQQVLRYWYPNLFAGLYYACYDVGHFRRLVEGTNAHTLRWLSDEKNQISHRALDDINRHWEEAKRYREWINNAELALNLAVSNYDLFSEKTQEKLKSEVEPYFLNYTKGVKPWDSPVEPD